MDDDSSFTESISVKSAAKMFGGQAVIRRIPTPSSKRRGPKPPPPKVPPRTSSRKPSTNMSGSGTCATGPQVDMTNMEKDSSGGKENTCPSADVGDVLDKPLVSLSEINGISECESYDNVADNDSIPSYEQFIHGASLIDNDNDVDVLEDIEVVDNTAKLLSDPSSNLSKDLTSVGENSPKLLPDSAGKVVKDYTSMDYTVLGTISPLNARVGQGDDDKEEMSFVLGHTNSPGVMAESGLKRCLSPQSEVRPTSPCPNSGPSKRQAPALRGKKVAEVLPAVRAPKPSRAIVKQVGIMCEGCNNCLLDLKRQALRLVYPENSAAGPVQLVSIEISRRISDVLHW